MNYQNQEKIPVPRKRVFVLQDGRFVVQWEENRVQDLLSGRYSSYADDYFGNAITNYELNQLQNSGVVADYDDQLVYLQPAVNADNSPSGRTYYLNTTLHKSQVAQVRETLKSNDMAARFSVRVQEIFVILRGPTGMAFSDFDDAERAREYLVEQLPDLFKNTVVAFIEVNSTP